MAGAAKKDSAQYCGLTPREVELTIKAMITVLESGGKPDFEKLAQITQYKDAQNASKNWNFVKLKLIKAAGGNSDGQASGNNKGVGKKGGKRQAIDDPAAPDAKLSRVRESVDDDEENASGVKVEADENLEG